MDALYNTYVKLLAVDFLLLTPTSSDPNPQCFRRKGCPLRLSRTETVGVVTARKLIPDKLLEFSVDDGTGCITCIIWLNHFTTEGSSHFSRCNPSDLQLIADVASRFASQTQLGVVVRVRGRISTYRGSTQLTVSDVVVERDPNVEILHWLDCIKLARKCYDGGAIGK
ncbi:hypothetical protein U1Q18_041734 [Sarracenia purpurea var. burkii]